MGRPAFIGIDVSKRTLDVAFGPDGPVRTLAYDGDGLRRLGRLLAAVPDPFVCLEGTGGYERPLPRALAAAGVPYARVNPRQARRFAQAAGRLDKTDRLDARLLALYAERMRPGADEPPSARAEKRRDLDARRRQVVEQITRERNRLAQAADPDVRRLIGRAVGLYEDRLRELDGLIAEAVAADESARRAVRRMTGVPGVGAVTASRLVALPPELGTLNRREVARLAGLAPVCRDSGTLRGRRAIGGGRPEVRSALYMATLVATKHNPTLRAFYRRLVERGKAKMAALAAAMRKLLTILNALLKTGSDWRPLPEPA
ncbi:MAG TPA: transposase [Planctomycetaceae bacterium]